MESWQIFSYALDELPSGFLLRLFTRSYPLIQSWAAGPMNEVRHRNPIDRIAIMLAELKKAGRGDVARAAIDIMALPLGGHFTFFENTQSDKGNLDGEATDATIALGRFLETCREALGDDTVSVDELMGILDRLRFVQDELNQIMDVIKSKAGR